MTLRSILSHTLPTARRLADDAAIAAKLAACAVDPDRPLMAHVVVTRRCNLACGYCVEYDHVSAPVPLEVMKARLDHLAALGTVFVTLTGGEPLLHPDLIELVRHVRARGMVPAMNTNAYLLTRRWIDELGEAGLYAMQISIDNVTPGEVSKKSLRPLRGKLRLLAAHARFRVRINTVLGSGPPEEVLEVTRAVMAHGFEAKCSLEREPSGALRPLDARRRAIYDQVQAMGRRASSYFSEDFQVALLRDGHLDWKCRAGARFFTVCDQGLVHLCTPRMHQGAVPLLAYGKADIRRAFAAKKACASGCPIAYAHQGSQLDTWRGQRGPAHPATAQRVAGRVHLPVAA
ncbi:MAG: radical SAM protein [Kofleriaceae bacterium]